MVSGSYGSTLRTVRQPLNMNEWRVRYVVRQLVCVTFWVIRSRALCLPQHSQTWLIQGQPLIGMSSRSSTVWLQVPSSMCRCCGAYQLSSFLCLRPPIDGIHQLCTTVSLFRCQMAAVLWILSVGSYTGKINPLPLFAALLQ